MYQEVKGRQNWKCNKGIQVDGKLEWREEYAEK